MRLIRITDKHSKYIPALESLYESAFPKYERRVFTELLELLPDKAMQVYVAVPDGKFAGFCIFWQLDGFVFLEHLAVVPELRGQRIGQQMVQWLLQITDEQLILEVELPTDEPSKRRITFYERLGFILHPDVAYQQPPYSKNGFPVPMLLMSRFKPENKVILLTLADDIRKSVYERHYR